MGGLSHNFASRYARKPNKDFKQADYSLVFKNILSHKIGLLGWRPEPGILGQKGKSMPPLWRHPQTTPNPKWKHLFKIWTRRLAKCRGCEHLSGSIGWRVMALQSFAKKWRTRVLKGFKTYASSCIIARTVNKTVHMAIRHKSFFTGKRRTQLFFHRKRSYTRATRDVQAKKMLRHFGEYNGLAGAFKSQKGKCTMVSIFSFLWNFTINL